MKYQDKEIFAIPIGHNIGLRANDQVFVLYAPLSGYISLIDRDDERAIREHIESQEPINKELQEVVDDIYLSTSNVPHVNDISKTTKMSLLPSLACNFACSYCYSAKGRSSTILSWEKAKIALDYFINPYRIKPQHLSLFISGGGEPLLSWDITKKCIEYAFKRCQTLGYTIHISVVTNGSLITSEIAEFLSQHSCSVCVSFEVLQSLQDLQRKNFDIVNKNIQLLNDKGVRVMLNSTITPTSVAYMEDMVNAVAERYPNIAQYTMEPVTSVDLFASRDKLGDFYNQFYINYLRSKEIAKHRNVPLRFTYDDALRDITIRHCPGKFCITPQGTISACHLVSSPMEERYAECIYGEIADGEVKIDKERFDKLYSINLFHYDRCHDCFAKFSCGGECMTRNAIYPAEFMDEVCKFNRRFILHQLVERIEESIQETCGLTLEEYVKEYR
ncbi:MAG: radical SAM protein [Alistipes sp.]|nr:radical SAM protein [Alistipes sp.]